MEIFSSWEKLDIEIQDKIRQSQSEGKEQFLINNVGNYFIFALTWDDLFKSFELRNNFLLKNLDFDKQELIKQLEMEGVEVKDMPAFLTAQVLKDSK